MDPVPLIGKATQRVFVSGIALNNIVQHGDRELHLALSNGAVVEIVIAANTALTARHYALYQSPIGPSTPMIKLAHEKYKRFRDSLSSDYKKRFSVYSTRVPMCHSIGIYDNVVDLSEFCIGNNSVSCPSYLLRPSSAFDVYIAEAKYLLGNAAPLFGSNPSKLIRML